MGRGVFIVGAVVIALSLSGCVEQPAPDGTVDVGTEEFEVGGVLTQDEANEIADDSDSPYGVYVADDGSLIVVARNEPFPEAVVTEIQTGVSDLTSGEVSSFPELIGYIGGIEATTKRPVVVVYSAIRGWDDPERPESEQWFVATASNPSEALNNRDESARTREAAIAVAEAFIASHGGELIIVG